jgi:DEAD/DEAH box helicase domain-containing protein
VGFNQIRFDYEVLKAYSGFDFRSLQSYDILTHITATLNHRLSLNAVAEATLGVTKSADGLQSLEWWRQGLVEKVAEYCRKDVEVTRDLFFHILDHGYLLFEKKGIGLVRIPMSPPFEP